MRDAARFPSLDPSDGHYESFYLKAAAPRGGRALWIRHTVHKRPGQDPTCSIWFTLFDQTGGPKATKASFGADQLSVPEGAYIRVADAQIGPGRASGRLSTDALTAEWDLDFTDHHEAFHHLPSERMYRSRLPRTKLLSPHPAASFNGTVTIDGEQIRLERWPGMVGHNWGTEHAERWVWLQGGEFEGGRPGDYLDIAAGRIKLGPLTTPWVANGSLVLDGHGYRLGGLGRTYGTEIEARPTDCDFVIAGKGITVRGRVEADRHNFVGWIYADPDGGEHHVVNSSIATLDLRVERVGERHAHVRVEAGAAYELGMRETDHGVPVQEYADG